MSLHYKCPHTHFTHTWLALYDNWEDILPYLPYLLQTLRQLQTLFIHMSWRYKCTHMHHTHTELSHYDNWEHILPYLPYVVATSSRLLTIIGFFCRILSFWGLCMTTEKTCCHISHISHRLWGGHLDMSWQGHLSWICHFDVSWQDFEADTQICHDKYPDTCFGYVIAPQLPHTYSPHTCTTHMHHTHFVLSLLTRRVCVYVW